MIKVLWLGFILLAGCMSIKTYQNGWSSLWTPTDNEYPVHPRFESVVVVESPLGHGTGFVVGMTDENVYVLTAYHVIDNSFMSYFIGHQVAEIIRVSEVNDLAMLTLENLGIYQKVHTFGSVKIEDPVWAVGYTRFNEIIGVIHPGFVVSTDFAGFIAYNGGGGLGMSGGPLFNETGEVVGVASFVPMKGFSLNFTEFCFVQGETAKQFTTDALTLSSTTIAKETEKEVLHD